MENILWVLLDLYSDETPAFVAVVCGTKAQVLQYAKQWYQQDMLKYPALNSDIQCYIEGPTNQKGETELRAVFPDGQADRAPDFVFFPIDIVELG